MNEMQLGLFGPPLSIHRPDSGRDATIQERFEAFHQANPEIFCRLRDLALDRKRMGFRRWGVKAAWELLRYYGSTPDTDEEWALPNDFTSRYSRKLMAEVPELQGFFECREIKTP